MSLCKSVTYFSFSVGASCHPNFLPCSAAAELTREVMNVFWWWDSSPSSVREQPAIQFVLFTDVIKKKKYGCDGLFVGLNSTSSLSGFKVKQPNLVFSLRSCSQTCDFF